MNYFVEHTNWNKTAVKHVLSFAVAKVRFNLKGTAALTAVGFVVSKSMCGQTAQKKNWIFEKTWIFEKNILVPFGCTYSFWDNMTCMIQKFMNWRIFFIPCSFSNNKYFRSYRFQKFCEKKYWFFLKFGDLVENPLFFAR